jgi:hypothetical protein
MRSGGRKVKNKLIYLNSTVAVIKTTAKEAEGQAIFRVEGPFCFYIIPHFRKPLSLLAPCFTLVPCLAYSSAPKMKATCTFILHQWCITFGITITYIVVVILA